MAMGAAAVIAFAGLSAQPGTAAAANDNTARHPVLVELFTSEGCSSCPPADALLAQLDAQPINGAQVIVLSEHVTYWDQEGWRDPFSLEAMTQRQKQYAWRLGISDVYTPQAVIDGSAQLVGSNARGLQDAVTKAAAQPKEELKIADAQWTAGAVHFSVRGGSAPNGKTTLVAALAEDSAQSSVARGENAGKNLRHVAVVRAMQEMGKDADDGRALTLKASEVSKDGPLRLVVFLADRHNGHVLAVAEQTIPRT